MNKYNLMIGKLDGLEGYYTNSFDNANNEINKVVAKHNLSELYIRTNEIQKALDALSYVVEHGNVTIYATEAKELLSKLQDSVETKL